MGTVDATAKRGLKPRRYEILAEDLRHAIHSGRLAPGSALPSLRECAAQRALSLNTVTAAYRLLEDQGLIEARPQSGFYVGATLAVPDLPLRRSSASAQSDSREGLMDCVLQAQKQTGYLDLALACPYGRRFYPGERLARITASVLRRHADLAGTYALPPGSARLREQITIGARRLGMSLSSDDILITHGAMEALQLALRAVTHPGNRIGIEAPSYFNLYPLLASLGLDAIEIPTHPQHGLDMDEAERVLASGKVTALVAMPSIHNPLGCIMPRAAKQRLAGLTAQYRVPLIEDLVYAELQYADPPEPAVKSFDKEGWVIACSGFSKTLAPDYRIGWMEAGRHAERVRQLKFAGSGGESALLGEAVAHYLAEGHYALHLRKLRRVYAAQVAAVRGLVARYFPEGTRATQPSGGFLLWVELPDSVNSQALFHAALQHGIVVLPGQVYSRGARYRHCIRLSCCREIDANVERAIQTLGSLTHQMLRPAATRSRNAGGGAARRPALS